VQIRRGPAAVIGYEIHLLPLRIEFEGRREWRLFREPEDLPNCLVCGSLLGVWELSRVLRDRSVARCSAPGLLRRMSVRAPKHERDELA